MHSNKIAKKKTFINKRKRVNKTEHSVVILLANEKTKDGMDVILIKIL